VKLANIISEIEFYTYEGMIQVVYDDENSNKIAELIRALPGVTTVTLASSVGPNTETLKVKLISQKSGLEAFNSLKKNALDKYTPINDVVVAEKSIERK
jgi:hypothetical protein